MNFKLPVRANTTKVDFPLRQQIRWDYVATGAIVPFFAVNNFANPYQLLILKGIRFSAYFSNAAANVVGMLQEGWLVRIGSNNNNVIPFALNAVSSGATSPGATLASGIPLAQWTIPKEQNGVFQPCEYFFNQRDILTTTCQPMGNYAVAMPAGALVALNDQIGITLDLFFEFE